MSPPDDDRHRQEQLLLGWHPPRPDAISDAPRDKPAASISACFPPLLGEAASMLDTSPDEGVQLARPVLPAEAGHPRDGPRRVRENPLEREGARDDATVPTRGSANCTIVSATLWNSAATLVGDAHRWFPRAARDILRLVFPRFRCAIRAPVPKNVGSLSCAPRADGRNRFPVPLRSRVADGSKRSGNRLIAHARWVCRRHAPTFLIISRTASAHPCPRWERRYGPAPRAHRPGPILVQLPRPDRPSDSGKAASRRIWISGRTQPVRTSDSSVTLPQVPPTKPDQPMIVPGEWKVPADLERHICIGR
jgi:hypothetical protein